MAGLWNKYLVQRRDGTVPEWPYFVLGAADPAASVGLRAYATAAEMCGMDPQYVADIRDMANDWVQWRVDHDSGDPPDAPCHRQDDPAIIALMPGHGA